MKLNLVFRTIRCVPSIYLLIFRSTIRHNQISLLHLSEHFLSLCCFCFVQNTKCQDESLSLVVHSFAHTHTHESINLQFDADANSCFTLFTSNTSDSNDNRNDFVYLVENQKFKSLRRRFCLNTKTNGRRCRRFGTQKCEIRMILMGKL